MNPIYIMIAVLSGCVLPLQALINAHLGQRLGGPAWAAVISFAVGTVSLFIFAVSRSQTLPQMEQVRDVPLWAWTGGLLGAFYIFTTIISVRVLGTASMVALIIAGQIGAALLLDHFAVLQAPQAITPSRLVGAALLVLGVLLVLKK